MKIRLTTIALAALAFTSANGSTQLPLQVQNALTTIDSVPTLAQLDTAYGDHTQALASLSTIAGDDTTDLGIRLRAIHALTKYCAFTTDTNGKLVCPIGDPAHQALYGLIASLDHTDQFQLTTSTNVVLRGAIEAIGPQRVSTDMTLLLHFLDHPSRDVRAATAHALRDLCNSQAIGPLRTRLGHELTDQVRLAISEALRILGQPDC